eukprot:XP_008183240.2 PREDICTED: uncharacterized protein LOC103309489 [Acyrthosiphon pisum]
MFLFEPNILKLLVGYQHFKKYLTMSLSTFSYLIPGRLLIYDLCNWTWILYFRLICLNLVKKDDLKKKDSCANRFIRYPVMYSTHCISKSSNGSFAVSNSSKCAELSQWNICYCCAKCQLNFSQLIVMSV